jgi:hypothetical protein
MKAQLTLVSLIMAVLVGITLYFSYRHISTDNRKAEGLMPPSNQQPSLKAPSPEGPQETRSTPPPPPRISTGPIYEANPEPKRTLITPKQQLRDIEQYLPSGAQIVTYAISEANEKAAIAQADLLGDGRVDTVAIYTTSGLETMPGDRSLFLGVLAPEENKLVLKSSAPLYGGLIFTNPSDPLAAPFAVRDLTGNGHPEVIITSGVGASLGGAIQVYSFDGSSLRRLAFFEGQTFRVHEARPGKGAEISAQSRYENKPRLYQWDGREFKQQSP